MRNKAQQGTDRVPDSVPELLILCNLTFIFPE